MILLHLEDPKNLIAFHPVLLILLGEVRQFQLMACYELFIFYFLLTFRLLLLLHIHHLNFLSGHIIQYKLFNLSKHFEKHLREIKIK